MSLPPNPCRHKSIPPGYYDDPRPPLGPPPEPRQCDGRARLLWHADVARHRARVLVPARRVAGRLRLTETGHFLRLILVIVLLAALPAIFGDGGWYGTAYGAVVLFNPTARSVFGLIGWFPMKLYGAKGDGVVIDTTSCQNALLAAGAAGGAVLGKMGATFLIDAPLVISSFTTLDTTNATVRLKPGTGGNMLINTGLTAARSVIDAATTSASATITSATAAFTAGDVGKTVTVVDAGAGGSRLTTTILSVTNSTTAVLNANASATLTNTWVTIGTRDRNIKLVGGVWDRGANTSDVSGKGYSQNSIRLRRVDHVDVNEVEVASTAGKYGVNLGDCWDFSTNRVHARTTFSDIVHINGPAQHGRVQATSAENAGDDIVSITGSDFNTFATMADTAGDVADIVVDGVEADYGGRRGAILMAGTAPAALGNRAVTATNITYRSIKGLYATNSSVHVGGDFQDAATLGGSYAGILVDDVQADARSVTTSTVFAPEGTYENLTIRNVTAGISHDRPVQIGGSNASQSATIKRLVADRIIWPGGTSPNGFVTVVRGTVTSAEISNSQGVTTSTGTSVFTVSAASSTPTVSRALILNCDIEVAVGGSTSSIARVESGTTLGFLKMTNCHTKNVTYPLGRYFASCNVVATNIQCEGASALVRMETGTPAPVVTLQSTNITSNTYALSSGGGTINWLVHEPGQVTSVSAAYTAQGSDDMILGNATTAAFQVTLPTAVGIPKKQFIVKKTDASANAVTVGTTSAQTIDGAATHVLGAQHKFGTYKSDGANWRLVGSN